MTQSEKEKAAEKFARQQGLCEDCLMFDRVNKRCDAPNICKFITGFLAGVAWRDKLGDKSGYERATKEFLARVLQLENGNLLFDDVLYRPLNAQTRDKPPQKKTEMRK